jgi:hypothetical protein
VFTVSREVKRARDNRRYYYTKKKVNAKKKDISRMMMLHPTIEKYDNSKVQKLWEESIQLGVSFDDPFECTDLSSYRKVLIRQQRRNVTAKKNQDSFMFNVNFTSFRELSYNSQLSYEKILRFEQEMWMTDMVCCSVCNKTRLTNKRISLQDYICSSCKENKGKYTENNIMQPVWYLQGSAQYHIPKELSGLTIGEQLLIQIVAPYVPIVHIKNGVLGSKGHTCSFMQEVSELCVVLPRHPNKVTALKFIRHYKSSNGDIKSRIYNVRRFKVMLALQWLIKYHVVYKEMYENGELKICEDNLDWIGSDKERDLISVVDIELNRDEDQTHDLDRGVAPEQCMIPLEVDNNEFEQSGIQGHVPNMKLNENDKSIMSELKGAKVGNSVIEWPSISDDPVSEYSGIKLFTLAFPWLFPGGICDINECNRLKHVEIADWLEQLVYHKDGRFAKDPIFGFFALNYMQRHRNTKSGGWFLNNFATDIPCSLSDLKKKLSNGDDSFLSKLAYFGKKTRGTDSYWRCKKSELFTWINHHVSAGHGAPTVFMTLSCAEFHWPDLKRILEKRIWIESNYSVDDEGNRLDSNGCIIDLSNNIQAMNKAVNDYSIVVQEFFQLRVKKFLQSVGIHKFGIDYYWLRFEFAPGRGQIHCHLLGIQRKQIVAKMQKDLFEHKGDPKAQGDIAGTWAEEIFGMTAMYPGSTPETKKSTSQSKKSRSDRVNESCGKRLAESCDYANDKTLLCGTCQCHICSNYCLRKKKKSKLR